MDLRNSPARVCGLGIFLALALSTQAAWSDPYVHAPSGVSFPDQVAGLQRRNVNDYEAQHPGSGVSVKYQSTAGLIVDVYAYTAGLRQIPNDINNPVMAQLRQLTETDIANFAKSKGAEVRRGESMTVEVETSKSKVPVLYNSYVIVFPDGSRNSFVWLWPARNHFFKIRISRLPGDGSDPRVIREFYESFVRLTTE